MHKMKNETVLYTLIHLKHVMGTDKDKLTLNIVKQQQQTGQNRLKRHTVVSTGKGLENFEESLRCTGGYFCWRT